MAKLKMSVLNSTRICKIISRNAILVLKVLAQFNYRSVAKSKRVGGPSKVCQRPVETEKHFLKKLPHGILHLPKFVTKLTVDIN